MPNYVRTLQLIIREPNEINNDRPFHLEVRVNFCGAHLLKAGSKVWANKRHNRISFLHINESASNK